MKDMNPDFCGFMTAKVFLAVFQSVGAPQLVKNRDWPGSKTASMGGQLGYAPEFTQVFFCIPGGPSHTRHRFVAKRLPN